MTTTTRSHKHWTDKGGHITSSCFSDEDMFILPNHNSLGLLSQTISYISSMTSPEFIKRTNGSFARYLTEFS